jgi:Lhr-like helicase
MHSLISIVGMVLTNKENYREWYRKIKRTLIYNYLWKGIYEAVAVPHSSKITK